MLSYLCGLIISIDTWFIIILLALSIYQFSKGAVSKLFVLIITLWVSIYQLPVGQYLLQRLENQYQAPSSLESNVAGIILLGGAHDLYQSTLQQPIYNLAASRLLEFITLANRYPQAKLLLTGTSIESALAKQLLINNGIAASRLIIEDASTNTIDNARNSKAIVGSAINKKWLLVTSAFHMPRSVVIFQHFGWKVVPYPVDYHAKKISWSPIALPYNILSFRIAIKEMAGIINFNLQN